MQLYILIYEYDNEFKRINLCNYISITFAVFVDQVIGGLLSLQVSIYMDMR